MKNRSSWPSWSRKRAGPATALRSVVLLAIASTRLWRHELEVDRAHDEVGDEQEEERDDHGLVDGVTDALGPAAGVHAHVGRDDRGQHAEDECLGHALPEVW